jgi:SOS-response transcriptional repressor LexA
MMDNVTRDAVAARLKEARAKKYASAAEAARAIGMKEVTVRAHESAQNGVSAWQAHRYAQAYGVSPNWILYGTETPSQAEIGAQVSSYIQSDGRLHRPIPIVGDVAAGLWKEALPTEAYAATGSLDIIVDGYQRASLSALRVVGTSMNKLYPEGRYVIVAPVAEAGLREHDHVVVQRDRGGLVETSLKELVTEGGRPMLYPRSTDPAFQSPIDLIGVADDQDAPVITAVVVADYSRRDRGSLPIFVPLVDAE